MKLIIDIPEEQYRTLNAKMQEEVVAVIDNKVIITAVKNGTPLSESDDCVSRQAVLEALRTMYDTHIIETEDGDEYIDYNDTVYEMEQLPPVTPAEKVGQWILLDECSNSGYYCSECHKRVVKEGWSDTVKIIKYCPNCGAKMDVPDNNVGEMGGEQE